MRTGEAENLRASRENSAMRKQAFDAANANMARYNDSLAKIEGEGNPYDNPNFKANQNKLATIATSAVNSGAKEAVDSAVGRTGTNTASLQYTKDRLAHDQARTNADLMTKLDADNYSKGRQWDQWLLGAKMAPVSGYNSEFGTATSGQGDALRNLTQYDLASMAIPGQILGAAGAGLSAYLGRPKG